MAAGKAGGGDGSGGSPRDLLEERRDDAPLLDDRRYGAGHLEQGEEIGGRKELAEDLEAALAAAHAGEPVVDEGDGGSRDAIVRQATGGH
jgi:hypothetical protein